MTETQKHACHRGEPDLSSEKLFEKSRPAAFYDRSMRKIACNQENGIPVSDVLSAMESYVGSHYYPHDYQRQYVEKSILQLAEKMTNPGMTLNRSQVAALEILVIGARENAVQNGGDGRFDVCALAAVPIATYLNTCRG